MASSLEPISLCHVNAIVDGYESALSHFTGLYEAVLNIEVPDNGERRACLITLGGLIFELVANDRHAERVGDRYIGAEYRVPSVAEARQKCEELRLPIVRDGGRFFHTDARACHGISWEIFDEDWRFLLSPASAERHEGWRPIPAQAYWAEHPMGLTGLVRLSVAVEDVDVAVDRLGTVAGAEVMYRVDRPEAGAMAAGMRVADTTLELLAPTGSGPVRDHLDHYGEGIRSTVFGVLDLGRAQRYLSGRGVGLVDGDAPGARAVRPEHNHGLRFELTERAGHAPLTTRQDRVGYHPADQILYCGQNSGGIS